MKAKNRKHWTRGRALAREGVQNAMGGGFWSTSGSCAVHVETKRRLGSPKGCSLLAATSTPRRARRAAADGQEQEQEKQKGLRLPAACRRTKKTMLPFGGTSSFVVAFLTRGKWVKLPRGEHVTFVCRGIITPNGVDELFHRTGFIT